MKILIYFKILLFSNVAFSMYIYQPHVYEDHYHDYHAGRLYHSSLFEEENADPKLVNYQSDLIFDNTLNNTVLENSKQALNSFMMDIDTENKNLFYSSDKNINIENNLLEFMTENLLDTNNKFDPSLKEDTLEFFDLFQKIFNKYQKVKNLKNVSPNFTKYLIFYLSKILKNYFTGQNKFDFDKNSVNNIFEFLQQLENLNSENENLGSKDFNKYQISSNMIDRIIESKLNVNKTVKHALISTTIPSNQTTTLPETTEQYTTEFQLETSTGLA
ncbi:unnamed protein product [Brachionus calyciflorus]|uniref:Uncharacterized protein n=1 Tax=Brachionus calyciflorus TaxID=104777 RepID=A0A813LZH8_9BILA|nr:unnamed protein product [Brachionus calyciflorus]